MNYIKFTKLKVSNLLSIGNTPIVIDFKPGIHIITGSNKDRLDRQNGVGKSTICEAFNFAVFGETIRTLKKDLMCNNITNGQCVVELEFTTNNDNYKIIRTLNPSKLSFYKNGADITRDSIKNTESDIHALLYATTSIFENCVILTMNNSTPFMAKTKVEKRKFIEGIFDLDIFSKMLSYARDEYNEIKKSYEIELTKFESFEKIIASLNEQNNKFDDIKSDEIKNLEKQKKQIVDEIAQKRNEITTFVGANINAFEQKIELYNKATDKLDNKIEKLQKEHTTLTTTVATLKENEKNIGTDKDKCPVCLKPITSDDVNHVKAEKAKIKEAIINNNLDANKIKAEITALKDKKQQIKQLILQENQLISAAKESLYKFENLKTVVAMLESRLNDLNKLIVETSTKSNNLTSLIEKTKIEANEASTNVMQKKSVLSMLDTVKYILSEEGVKSYIISKALDVFNDKISYYLSKLESKCTCYFDELFEEKIFNEKRKSCSYFNFSGAERKDIDFACLFAFIDMRKLQSNVTYNVSFYDELLDSCLDSKGIKLITNILKERAEKYNECIYIISHRKENAELATGEVIMLEKENGITKRVD